MNPLLKADICVAIAFLEAALASDDGTKRVGYLSRAAYRLQSAVATADLEAEQAERREMIQ